MNPVCVASKLFHCCCLPHAHAAMFDRVDPSCQVDEATALTSVLERCVWPVLGVGPVLQQGVAAWVYFKQYLITRDARQLRQLKYLMSKVLTQTEVTPLPRCVGEACVGGVEKGWRARGTRRRGLHTCYLRCL